MIDVCIKCGAKRGEKPFIGPFCVDCYEFKIKLPKKPIEIEVCKRCGKVKVKGEWSYKDEEEIKAYIASKIKGEFDRVDIDMKSHKVFAYFKSDDGEVVKRVYPLKIELKRTTCPTCAKISGGYYEAIIQLRGNPYRIEKMRRDLERRLSKRTFITKEDVKKEGIDLYVGSSKEVIQTLKEMGIRAKISKKLHGMKEGKRLYRTTFAIRL